MSHSINDRSMSTTYALRLAARHAARADRAESEVRHLRSWIEALRSHIAVLGGEPPTDAMLDDLVLMY